MKNVIITQRIDAYPLRNERRDALDQRLSKFILDAGYLPIPVPNCINKLEDKKYSNNNVHLLAWLEAIKPIGLILSGGNNIGDCMDRDNTEIYMLKYAEKNELRVLGICRGMQMLAHYASTNCREVQGHIAREHKISGEITRTVTCYHQYSIINCPAGYRVTAMAEDGVIESIQHETRMWEGWMWHPERNNTFLDDDLNRLRMLFS